MEGVGAGEMGECGSRVDARVWEQGRWKGVGADEMGGFGSRVDGRVWETQRHIQDFEGLQGAEK